MSADHIEFELAEARRLIAEDAARIAGMTFHPDQDSTELPRMLMRSGENRRALLEEVERLRVIEADYYHLVEDIKSFQQDSALPLGENPVIRFF